MTKSSLAISSLMASLLTISIFQTGCTSTNSSTLTSSSSDSTSNASQSAVAESNNQASASESATTVGFTSAALGPGGEEHAMSACSYASRTTCSSSVDNINWSSCTIDGGLATMTGGWVETFTGNSSGSCTVPIVAGETVVRTSPLTSTLTTILGGLVVTDTDGGTAWDGTVIPNTGSTIVNNAGTRTITVNGTHKLGKTSGGFTLFDHYIATTTPLTVTGKRATSDRQITGAMKVYHNLAKYTAATTFNTVKWTSTTCCYPTSGSVTATLTGSVVGNTTLTFSTTCGQATYVDTSGLSSTITLSQCN